MTGVLSNVNVNKIVKITEVGIFTVKKKGKETGEKKKITFIFNIKIIGLVICF